MAGLSLRIRFYKKKEESPFGVYWVTFPNLSTDIGYAWIGSMYGTVNMLDDLLTLDRIEKCYGKADVETALHIEKGHGHNT